MKTLYFECKMGAAGDMLAAALYELLPDKTEFLNALNAMRLPGVSFSALPDKTCGICGTHFKVCVDGETEEDGHEGTVSMEGHHHGRTLGSIMNIISALSLPETVKKDVAGVYELLAGAESKAHGTKVELVHFHELGALDAVGDIAAVCLAVSLLKPDAIKSSPINLGGGFVRCAHGLLPVPAPATAELIKGTQSYCSDIDMELCTPTGAALISYFTGGFCPMPEMRVQGIGIGVGTRKIEGRASCVRAFFGEEAQGANGEIVELCCHIDDMTSEALSFAAQRLMELGALDVSTAAIIMKKGRLGFAFTVLCEVKDEERLAKEIIKNTTTAGVRTRHCRKYFLKPSVGSVTTSFGEVQTKNYEGFGICRKKPEYASVSALAKEKGVPFAQVWNEANR